MTVTAIANQPQVISYTVTYDEIADGDPLVLPTTVAPGWMVDDVGVETLVAFNGTGDRDLNVGIEGDPDALIAELGVKTVGIKSPSPTKYRAEATKGLVIQLVTETDTPTAGVIRVSFTLVQVAREN